MSDQPTTNGHRDPVAELRARAGHYVSALGTTSEKDARAEYMSALERVEAHIDDLRSQANAAERYVNQVAGAIEDMEAPDGSTRVVEVK